MALTHLLDTSVLKRLDLPPVDRRLKPMARNNALGRASICDLEVGFSARNVEEWDEMSDLLDVFVRVETSGAHVRRALQVQRLLAARSQRGRKLPDLLVAAAAEERDLVLLHYDADFDRIAEVTGQRCEWVAPAGSLA